MKSKSCALINIYAVVLLLMSVCFASGCDATKLIQERSTIVKNKPPTIAEDATIFPIDWLGIWKGNLEIYNTGGKLQTVPMSLEIKTTRDTLQYDWLIQYSIGPNGDHRKYTLTVVNPEKGQYQIDEHNGILLDASLINNELVSIFKVLNNQLISTYKLEGNNLIFEIIIHEADPSKSTSDTLVNGEKVPLVQSYQPTLTQKAVLTRFIP